jgi:cytochrome c-type protein NapC
MRTICMIRRWWASLRERCRTCSRVTLGAGVLLVTVVTGGVLLAAGAAGLAWTNTEGFCTGCHEMRDNVYAEFKGTIHDVNRSGVRAVCSDCHVPREPVPMLKRKVAASFELWGHLVGKLDTKEKFEKQRYEMAKSVWTTMLRNDSHECRNCHKTESMDAEKQSERARARHAKARAEGQTCILCHSGIAHKEPDGPGPRELKVAK